MPIIRFSGLEEERLETIREMFPEIKIWAASVKDLEIGTEHVRPIYSSIVQEIPGECVIFEVLELFSVSFAGTPRTADMRKALCQSIETGFNKFADTRKLNVRPKKAVVIVRTVNRDEWEFHYWDIPTSSKKDLSDDGHNFFRGVECGSRDPHK